MTIIYKNKTYPFRLSYYAMKQFKAETGLNFTPDAIQGDNLENLEIIFYHALVAGCNHSEIEPPKREEIALIVDACLDQFFAGINNDLPKSTDKSTQKKTA